MCAMILTFQLALTKEIDFDPVMDKRNSFDLCFGF